MEGSPNLTNFTFNAVVKPAIVEHKLHVIHEFLQLIVLTLLQPGFNGTKVHRFLNNGRVVRDAKSLHINWFCKDVGFRVALKCLHETLSSFLPLIENWRSLRHIRNWKVLDWSHVFILLSCFKVFRKCWIFNLELLELRIGHGFIIAIFFESSEQVALRDLLFILLWLILGFGLVGVLTRYLPLYWLILFGIEWHSTILKQEFKNLLFVVFFRPMSGCHILLVFLLQIDSLLKQILHYIEPFILNGVVERPLQLVVYEVIRGTTTNQELCRLHVALTNTIEYCSLSVLVTAIDI